MNTVKTFDRGSPVQIPLDHIEYIEGADNYSILHTADRHYLVSKTLRMVLDGLSDPRFIRIHKQYVINLSHVVAITLNRRQRTVLLRSARQVPLARRSVEATQAIEAYLAAASGPVDARSKAAPINP